MSKSNPYVGPRGESSPEQTPPTGWTADELVRAQEHVTELLQRELEHAHHLATVPVHGAPQGRTQGYYAARAYLLACHLYPRRLVLGMTPEQLGVLRELNALDGMWTLPDEPAATHFCGRCGTTGTDGPDEHAEVCDLLRADRAAKGD